MTLTVKNINSESDASVFIAQVILNHLRDEKKVFWLISGGSAIKTAVEASKYINKHPHHNLSVTLTDERFGTVGHKDSNWKQLLDAGFKLPEAKLFPVLQGEDASDTTESFANTISREFAFADFKVGLFGVGIDGCTAGILPRSEAVFATGLTFKYKAPKFERIIITTKTILELDEAVIYAEGKEKEVMIRNLEKELGVYEQPAQILKKIPKLAIFFKL